MLQFFRNFMKSKVGVGITLGFLAIIAFAFASSDVANSSLGGGLGGGDQVAVVGGRRIPTTELSTSATSALEQARQQNPTLTMQAFVAQGGLTQTLDQLISRTALAEFGRQHGLRAGKRLIDSELAQIPAFQGADGKFSRESFNAILSQRQLTEAAVREDFTTNLITRQLLTPVAIAPTVAPSIAARYAALLREQRHGALAVLPSALFAPAGEPSAAQLQTFYQASRDKFIRPERRVIRYVTFGEDVVGDRPAPTDAQIAQRYQRDRARYAAVENRTFTQLVLPTQAAAQALLNEVKAGKSLTAAGQAKGLRTAQVGPVNRQAVTASASAAVADAVFSGMPGTLSAPVRGGLGWYIIHIDKVDRQPARTVEQVRGEISAALAVEQRAAALADLTARLEEEFDGGTSLADVAKELKLTLSITPPVTADGRLYGTPDKTIPPELGKILQTAFQMEEAEPQLDQLVPGKSFVIFDVPAITPSAVAPLVEIRADVVALWRATQGSKAAKAAADAVLARLAKGETLAAAMRAVKPNAPAAEQLNLGREDLAKQGRVPPQLALFFSMAEGTAKKLEAPNQAGWYLIQLSDIEVGKLAANDPIVVATQRQLASVGGEEYLAQFVKAAEKEVGVERNPAALTALQAQLTGKAAN